MRADQRRSGPPGEDRWWDPVDQALAEQSLLDVRSLGRGWRPVRMVNNAERLEPFGHDPHSARVEEARQARRPTALDEGQAWRHRDAGTLAVVRSEVYADEAPGAAEAHRAAWREHAEAVLDATWRERWRERDREPAWIEARWRGRAEPPHLDDRCDWLQVEDHTPAIAGADVGAGTVLVYEHLTVWAGRRQVTVVVRHEVGLDLDDVVERSAAAVLGRIAR